VDFDSDMATKGAKSASVDFDYLDKANKDEKKKKKLIEEVETEWKGPSSKERKQEAESEKAQRAAKKMRALGKEAPASRGKQIGGCVALCAMFGAGAFQFLETMMGAMMGNGVTMLELQDTVKLKEVLFGGEPWLIYCVTNDTRKHRLPRVLEEHAHTVKSSIGLNIGVLSCWDQTDSGRSIAQRFKLSLRPPLSFVVANGNKPSIVNLGGVSKAEDLERKAKLPLALSTNKISSLKDWPALCTTKSTCVVIAYKQFQQRDSALALITPMLTSHRSLKIVTLDTSFWSLKLSDSVMNRRPEQVKGSYRADVLCLAREEAAITKATNATHRGDFVQELDSSTLSSFFTACEKRADLVQIGVPPKIRAKTPKKKAPTVIKATSPPNKEEEGAWRTTKAPSPATKPKDPRSDGAETGKKLDPVGSRAAMEKAAEAEALFEAVEEGEGEGEDGGNVEAGDEDTSDEASGQEEDADAEEAESDDGTIEL